MMNAMKQAVGLNCCHGVTSKLYHCQSAQLAGYFLSFVYRVLKAFSDAQQSYYVALPLEALLHMGALMLLDVLLKYSVSVM